MRHYLHVHHILIKLGWYRYIACMASSFHCYEFEDHTQDANYQNCFRSVVTQNDISLSPLLSPYHEESDAKDCLPDLGLGEMLITWPILNGFPDFKDQQTHDAPDVLLVLFLKKLTTPKQS